MATMATKEPVNGVIVAKNYPDNLYYAEVKLAKCSCTWTINKISLCGKETGEKLFSPEFTTGDSNKAKWCMDIFPKGENEELKHYVSIYLCLLSCEKDTTIRAQYNLSIIDGKRKKNSIYNMSMGAYHIGESWGSPKFMKHDFLLDEANKLLPNDQLTILCELGIVEKAIINKSTNGKYAIRRLSLMCENTLCNNLELENAAHTLILADLHNASHLKIQAIKFITKYCNEVVNTKGYKLLIDPSHVCLLGELFQSLSSSVKGSNEL